MSQNTPKEEGKALPEADGDASFRMRRLDRSLLKSTFANVSWETRGKVCDVVGTVVEGYLPGCRLGSLVDVAVDHGRSTILAEVVGFRCCRFQVFKG